MRILTGGILQESNTFSSKKSTMDDFRQLCFAVGEQLEQLKVVNEVRGFYDVAKEEGAELVPTLFCSAVSSGSFRGEAFTELKELLALKVRESLAASGGLIDAAIFAFHGAMVAEGCDDADGELIAVIRKEIGDQVPLIITLDAHANITRKIVQAVSGIVGYRTYPHVDFREVGQRAARLLISTLRGEVKPHISMRKIPMVVPAENSQFHSGPCGELWNEAAAGERRGDSLVTSLFPVQPWLDIEEFGSAVVVVGDDWEKAEREADRLAQAMWDKRHEFDVRLYSVDEAVELALQGQGCGEPFVISDSADSPGAGSTGDSNAVLKRLLELGVESKLTCLLSMVDAPAVAKAIEAGLGAEVELTVGYTLNSDRSHGEPMNISGKVMHIGEGKFEFSGGTAPGSVGNMGRCVVLRTGTIDVLLQTQPVFTGDPAMYRSVGLEPQEADLVLVKSANQFRADYESITGRIYILDTPGSSSANLRKLPFRKIERPMYPFDDHFNWGNNRS
ncbi:M81 family metallopeptidase [Paenibacillus mendelii]|uniref:M81 family metallopeptidase n=1 Tax=Paenibacillus mendelii TaxID=206163 RepID=A0ABV6JL41_9BACL|nr:M81 family metallopeptidase [Paenibacillus mendelii]MCQ6562346.1 M81 family metallopeptidase [Paenibacillus mendelii]